MFQLHVLIHATLGPVGLVAALDGALVVPLDLSCSSTVSLALVVPILTAIFVGLVVQGGQSMVRNCNTDISRHLRCTICVYALPDIVDLVHVVLAKRLDRLPTEHCLLESTISSTSTASSSAGLAAPWLLENSRVLIEGIRWGLVFVLDSVDQFLALFDKLLKAVCQH